MVYVALPATDVFTPNCFGDPAFSPKEDDYSNRAELLEHCLSALAECGPCPVRARCIYQVRPRPSKFDGVCGGRIWYLGEVVATLDGADDRELPRALKQRDTCGTQQGIDTHYTRGEQYCTPCRDLKDSSVQLQLTA
ncbi:hypothetical protein [Kitasatospora aureofaciens]|uniref:hypothetical protein n=1 Tax=Kitasatospora aureofaciens TaxID=1894 RepID=UPI0037C89751